MKLRAGMRCPFCARDYLREAGPQRDPSRRLRCTACASEYRRDYLKDSAPAVGAGAPGVEPTGCSPPAPSSTREDIPPERTVTVPAED
jgi:hypothetical protein